MEHHRQQFEQSRLTADKSMDFECFIDTLYALLETVWGEGWGTFIIAHPTTNNANSIGMPQITYNLKKMTPGQVGRDTQEIKPRLRESFQGVSSLTGEPTVVNVKGQMVDCEVEFAIYAENNKEALFWTKRFRETLNQYKGFLMQKGLQNLWFLEDVDRNGEDNLKDKVASRGLTYNVRIEEVTEEEVNTIKSISYQVDVVQNKLEMESKLPSQQ